MEKTSKSGNSYIGMPIVVFIATAFAYEIVPQIIIQILPSGIYVHELIDDVFIGILFITMVFWLFSMPY